MSVSSFASNRHAVNAGRAALGFLLLAVCVFSLSTGLALLLMRLFGRQHTNGDIFFPWAFAISTPVLFSGSATLHLALRAIRQEQQRLFRKWMLISLGSAILFVGAQFYGLWTMFPAVRRPGEAELGVTAFLFTAAALHVAHFFVATLFVCYATVQGFMGRYDHEYYWGVKVCAWFWHALGAIWIVVLAVFTIVIR